LYIDNNCTNLTSIADIVYSSAGPGAVHFLGGEVPAPLQQSLAQIAGLLHPVPSDKQSMQVPPPIDTQRHSELSVHVFSSPKEEHTTGAASHVVSEPGTGSPAAFVSPPVQETH